VALKHQTDVRFKFLQQAWQKNKINFRKTDGRVSLSRGILPSVAITCTRLALYSVVSCNIKLMSVTILTRALGV
jgi:hypothetical protein